MNFERFQCQKFIEAELGCLDYTRLNEHKANFLAYTIRADKLEDFKVRALSDSRDLYFKALVSFLEATNGIKRGQSSWPIVKLYYSLFYSLRVYLISSGYIILKSGSRDIYGLKLAVGEIPFKITNKNTSGDHKTTIKAFKDVFGDNEKINTNTINGKHVFDWIMEYRELVNYRINSFIEPDYGYDVIPVMFSELKTYDSFIGVYLENPDIIHCFLEDHSIYATPLIFLKKSFDLLSSISNGQSILSDERAGVVRDIIEQMELGSSEVLASIMD